MTATQPTRRRGRWPTRSRIGVVIALAALAAAGCAVGHGTYGYGRCASFSQCDDEYRATRDRWWWYDH